MCHATIISHGRLNTDTDAGRLPNKGDLDR